MAESAIDLATALEASQAIAGEIVPERLVEKLLGFAVEHTNAGRGLLVFSRGESHQLEAEATAHAGNIDVRMLRTPITSAELPESVFRHALRTGEVVVVEDAAVSNPFANDEYLRARKPRSILCLPLVAQARLTGALYLENDHAPRGFAPGGIVALQLVVLQAATSLENARLSASLQQANTERLRAEERFQKAFHHSPAPMSINRISDATYIDINENNLKMLGYSREELIGKSPVALGILAQTEREVVRKARGTEGVARDVEVKARNKEGKVLDVLISSVLIELGGEKCFLTASYDITEKKRLTEQLLQSQKMEAIGLLAGGIAHDFNNLLTAINGYSLVALESLTPEHPLHKPVLEILKAGERASALTRQLLSYSRKQLIAPEVHDLNGIVRSLEAMLERVIGEDVELVVTLDPRRAEVKIDRGQAEQIVVNLAVNARDAMPEGGRLVIRTLGAEVSGNASEARGLAAGPYVLLEISDTGTGMSREVMGRIFEPFFTTKEVGKGTGLGLSTVYGIVKQGGGDVFVQSELGKGTTFSVYLPRIISEPAPRKAPTAPRPVSSQGNETILLVEDEALVRALCASVLESSGYRVLQAKSGVEAVKALEARGAEIHMIITDVVMPDMGGRALVERARELLPDLPVLFISGYPDLGAAPGAPVIDRGAYLQKPFGPTELVKRVRAQLDRRGT
jgi:two-component system, cell cycle sensor histidine kinase and response regulator CckA